MTVIERCRFRPGWERQPRRYVASFLCLVMVTAVVTVMPAASATAAESDYHTGTPASEPRWTGYGSDGSGQEWYCAPVYGPKPEPSLPPSSYAEFAADVVGGEIVETLLEDSVAAWTDVWWSAYSEALQSYTPENPPPPTYFPAEVGNPPVKEGMKSWLKGTLTSRLLDQQIWAGVIQRIDDRAMPAGVRIEEFLGFMPYPSTVQPTLGCGALNNDVRLYQSGGRMFAHMLGPGGMTDGSTWAEVLVDGELPHPGHLIFQGVPGSSVPTWLVMSRGDWANWSKVLGTFTISSSPSRPLCPEAPAGTTNIASAILGQFQASAHQVNDAASWVSLQPWVPLPKYLDCPTVSASFNPFEEQPTLRNYTVRASADVRHIVGLSDRAVAASHAAILHYTRDHTSLGDGVVIGSGLFDDSSSGHVRLDMSTDGSTVVFCQGSLPPTSAGGPFSHYNDEIRLKGLYVAKPLLLHIPSATVGWPAGANSNYSCWHPTLSPDGGRVYWAGYVNDVVGWWSAPGRPPAAPPAEPPTVVGVVDPAATDNGWHTSPVTVTWYAKSGVETLPAPPPTTIDTEGPAQVVVSPEVCDSAGQCATGEVTLSVDLTPPTIEASQQPSPTVHGWANDSVTVSFSCADLTSGVISCPSPRTVSEEGAGHSINVNAADIAGNTVGWATSNINIDLTPPTVALIGPADGSTIPVEDYVPPGCSATDELAGLDGECTVTVTDPHVEPGLASYTATATARDRAGNTSAVTSSYTVITDRDAPVITATASRQPNSDGWHDTPVTYGFTCEDEGSYVATCPPSATFDVDAANQSVVVEATDAVGNVGSLTVAGVNVDVSAPIIELSTDRAVYGPADVVYVTCTIHDPVSGIAEASCPPLEISADTLDAGTNTLRASARDVAGNWISQTVTLELEVTPDGLADLAESYLPSDTPGGAGLAQALRSQLEAAEIDAFIGHVEAQCCAPNKGKRFTVIQRDTLVRFARDLQLQEAS